MKFSKYSQLLYYCDWCGNSLEQDKNIKFYYAVIFNRHHKICNKCRNNLRVVKIK